MTVEYYTEQGTWEQDAKPYTIRVTHWHARTGEVRRQYDRTVTASDRTDAIRQAWDRDPYAHRFEDVTP